VIPTTKSVITWFNLRVGFVGGSLDVEVKRTKARMTEWKVSEVICHVIQCNKIVKKICTSKVKSIIVS
jgi:hypothetical protein